MNRALRRHPVIMEPKAKGRPPRLPAKAPVRPRRKGFMRLVPALALEVVTELRKVTWPSRRDAAYLAMVVIVVSVVVGAVLGGIDYFFAWLIDKLIIR
jgi:preprotein translocase SecE subunit